jgi:anti-sigma factor RsiW
MMGDRNTSNDDMLRRLLGPQGPELSCEECFAELDRYVELELREADADARIPGMREHLEGCSACAEDHRSLRALVETESGSAASPRGD